MSDTTASSSSASIVGPAAGPMLNILGTRNEVKLDGRDCNGLASAFEVTAGPGDGIPLHSHTHEDELFYVLEGEVQFTEEGETSIGQTGTFAFLPRGRKHAWFVVGDVPARLLIMTIPGTFNAFFAELAHPVGTMRPMPEVIDICRRHGIEFYPAA